MDSPWTAPDLSAAPAAALLALHASVLSELRARKVLRTNNLPTGDYAEWLVWRALGGDILEGNSTKSYDLETPTFGRIQVKARLVSQRSRVATSDVDLQE
ncbi:hypothetical protein [Nocardioides sp. GCM10030258]|uniref:hypothetical protein n=1 Tax=unclassified Nocardioides TaxID=2615069 RepID=UPI0036201222